MNIERLEKAIEILQRPIPKKTKFDMGTFSHQLMDGLNQKCGTSGCIAYFIGQDAYFTNLGYTCCVMGPKIVNFDHNGDSKEVLMDLFDLTRKECRYIFFTTLIGPDIHHAIYRIQQVIDGDDLPEEEELRDNEI